MNIPMETVKSIYRRAIDPRASDGEGNVWWASVAEDVVAVLRAEDTAAAARVIAWWHHDWHEVGDSPRAAASRIRCASRALRVG
ncbi:hypothetical protein [Cupriavidus oxalaticus]|uniref:Uncharacterized protein n=1 Tax=Cupriavidus oxalaticus TaxID=96344 RepID=A0A5P3VR12_9BURK|nr:hypothetical protein [Cupriavidus oxalaticus]QEZ48796.1 hypothetical protein D2917_31465 [Cupriavidus oxalaticus]